MHWVLLRDAASESEKMLRTVENGVKVLCMMSLLCTLNVTLLKRET